MGVTMGEDSERNAERRKRYSRESTRSRLNLEGTRNHVTPRRTRVCCRDGQTAVRFNDVDLPCHACHTVNKSNQDANLAQNHASLLNTSSHTLHSSQEWNKVVSIPLSPNNTIHGVDSFNAPPPTPSPQSGIGVKGLTPHITLTLTPDRQPAKPNTRQHSKRPSMQTPPTTPSS